MRGFTLIELLVVITIIVVLLALLTPALDRAIYQAELAVCGAHQKGIASGVTVYAASQRRRYPYRPTMVVRSWARPENIAVGTSWDDRPFIIDYIDMDMLLDPLGGQIDLDPALSNGNDNAFSNFHLWYSFRFTRAGGGGGMLKLGDRWAWDGARYNVLVSDEDAPWINFGVRAGHPDRDGVLSHYTAQQEAPEDFKTGGVLATGTFTISRWSNDQDWRRGLLDTNYAYQDGGVTRIHDLKLNDFEQNEDERMNKVPAGDAVDPEPTEEYINIPKN